MNNKNKIVVVGLGYVGLSIAALFAQKSHVIGIDICESKVDKVNKKISPIEDRELSEFLSTKDLALTASTQFHKSIKSADFIILATPTNFDPITEYFDTETLEEMISKAVAAEPDATIVIKSTVPIGFTSSMNQKYKTKQIIFSPEFLREGKALFDNLYPSRIVVGNKGQKGKDFAELLRNSAYKNDIDIYLTGSNEAESIKLFSNTYLAMRVGFFNEIDNFCLENDLNSKDIIDAVCADPRVGSTYNNPSFGYGGYCLPKDTKQLLSQFENTPESLISSIVDSNLTRKQYLAHRILKQKPRIVGIYRLAMKQGSDNFRESSILGIIEILRLNHVGMVIFEPNAHEENIDGIPIEESFENFKDRCDIIVANRWDPFLEGVRHKVFTRDIYCRD